MTARRMFVVCLFSMIVWVHSGHGQTEAEMADQLVNLLSLHEGVIPVATPGCYGSWRAEAMLDGNTSSGWASESEKTDENTFVFEIPAAATFERFEFDTASADEPGAGAKDVAVEVSATSPAAGFTTVLTASLADMKDGQRFDTAVKSPARWVKLIVRNNHGSPNYSELFSFRGYAKKPAPQTPRDVSGTYDSSYSSFHVRQQGTALTGCYEYNGGLLEGTIEGRVMKLTWREDGGPENQGPAVMVFSEDATSFHGYWWHGAVANDVPNGDWIGTKVSSTVGACPHWTGSVGGELRKQLETGNRARLYGILFDFNSAVIRPESKPVLDEVVDLMKSEPEWTLTIEGHTDAIGADERNLTLSQQRADSVKAYLVEKGIDVARLSAAGFGETRPVADNDSELGRAQNRRVELVRK